MLRFLVKYLLLAIILAAAAMLTAQWKLEKDIDSFANMIGAFAEFDYESAKINLTGEVRINSIRIYINSIQANIEIGELRFSAGNLYDLAFLESSLREQQLPENGHLYLTDVLIPFNNTLLKAVKTDEAPTSANILDAAFCGQHDRISPVELEAMGFDYIAFSGKHFYLLDKYSGSVVFNGNFDVEEMFDVTYQINISGVMAWLESLEERRIGQFQERVIPPQLALLEVRKKDRGFNQKKAEYCAIREGVTTDEYYAGHITEVDKQLSSVGISVKDDFKAAYQAAIKPDSQLAWFIQPKANFEFEGVNYYTFEELRDLSGLRVSVNGTQVSDYFEGWTGENFNLIAENLMKERAAKLGATSPLYQQVVITREYKAMNLNRAAEFLEEKVRVTRDDGRVFEGILSRTSDRSIWLFQKSLTGDVTIPFARTRIVKFEVYQ
ncbi:hypothetical protein FLL45_14770 [Aliikangiella marina]|uniref:Uncharacterized protein n=1 Tax=Aliikangiella marina TaxID=1712262 RepID=A0A545TA92_9GAMM|nr:hypothetical protein [Aliikangiella marina]TQV74117.1 hypothetical protein FLL45_14770 [Aliikangiella marina]